MSVLLIPGFAVRLTRRKQPPRRLKLNVIVWMAYCLLTVWRPVQAEDAPLFLQRIQATEPGREVIIKAQQQIDELKEIKLREDISLGTFHKRNKQPIKPTELIYCNACHAPLPHSKSLRNRAFNNMHSQYIACESCHFRPENVDLSYRWFDYNGNSAAENTIGRFYAGRKKDDKTPLIERDGTVKIAPFYQYQPALLTRKHPFAKKLQERWKAADSKEKALIKATIHTPLEKKGPECAACHTKEEGMLDLTVLNATREQQRKIQQNTIADFFKHYKPDEDAAEQKTAAKEQRIRITDLLN